MQVCLKNGQLLDGNKPFEICVFQLLLHIDGFDAMCMKWTFEIHK